MLDSTPEQFSITTSFTSTPCLVIIAGPGCGKSTTLGLGVRAQRKSSWPATIGVAFNKDATQALQAKIPMIACKTLNALGLGVWVAHSHVRPGPPNPKKTREIINAIRDRGHTSIAPDEISDLCDLVAAAKTQGYGPPKSGGTFLGAPSFDRLVRLSGLDKVPGHWHALLDQILLASIELAYQGVLDFDDQIYMSTCFAAQEAFTPLFLLVIDEAQDLSPLQLRMLRRFNAAHYVFVGDPLQAIYAFRGAMSDAMERIYDIWPEALTLPLQTSFRLPADIVALLQPHNPQLTTVKPAAHNVYDKTADETCQTVSELLWRFEDKKTKAILCRNNAPLFRAALACIADRVPFNMANKQFGLSLIREIKYVCRTSGLRSTSSDRVCSLLYTHWFHNGPEGLERDALMDRYATCVAIAERTATGEGMCLEITSLNRQANPSDSAHPLYLSTAHRAKGLEFDVVVHLDPQLIPSKFASTPEQYKQEANIAYVINSRSLNTLVFLRSDQLLIPGAAQRQPRPGTKYKEQI